MLSDHSANQFRVMRSMSSRKARDEIVKFVSSAYSTSIGQVASSGGRVARRDRRSRRAAWRSTVKSTGLRLSPCGVSVEVANPWRSAVEKRRSNAISTRRSRLIRNFESPRNVWSVSRNVSLRIVSKVVEGKRSQFEQPEVVELTEIVAHLLQRKLILPKIRMSSCIQIYYYFNYYLTGDRKLRW